ncbi:MAG TPA: hypothetical protein DIW47_12245 [Bacteroidetes bacterium]|nr:hypothetical protein [Bacteroidota bacterium]
MNAPISTPALLNQATLENLLSQKYPDQKVIIKHIVPLALDNSSSILVTLTAASGATDIGHFRFLLEYETNGKSHQKDVVVKVKPHGKTIAAMLEGLAAAHGPTLGDAYKKASALTGFLHSHEKELYLANTITKAAIFPEMYGTLSLDEKGLFLIMMEYLGENELIDSVMEPEKWTDEHIRSALDQAAAWHAVHMAHGKGKLKSWPDQPDVESRAALIPLYSALWENASTKLPDLLSEQDYSFILGQIPKAGLIQKELDTFPKSQIHNDMNPRNTCFKRNGVGLQFVAYDWELSTRHLPQYDAVEFLCFVLDEDRYDLRESYLDYYRSRLEHHSGIPIEPHAFRRSCYLLHLDFCFLRLGMYLMAHALSPYPFLRRVVKSCMDGIKTLA